MGRVVGGHTRVQLVPEFVLLCQTLSSVGRSGAQARVCAPEPLHLCFRLVANTGAVEMMNFDVFCPCCSQRPRPRSLRPWLVLLVWGATWLPRERPNSSTSSDDGAAKSAFGGYRGVEPAVAVTCGSTTPRRLGCDSGISQWYRVGDAGALQAEPLATLCLARSKIKSGAPT